MRKYFYLLAFVSCMLSQQVMAQISKGYHGSVDAGYSVNTGGTISTNWAELNTVHGYQVNPYFFVGGGVGFHFAPEMKKSEIDGKPHWKRDGSMEIPIFADFRWTVLNKKVTPFVDARLGHYVTNGSGMYSSLGIGCRFNLKGSQAIYVLASYTITKLRYQESYMIQHLDYSYSWDYKDIDEEQGAISLKIGYEF
jgi:hypothetical protein